MDREMTKLKEASRGRRKNDKGGMLPELYQTTCPFLLRYMISSFSRCHTSNIRRLGRINLLRTLAFVPVVWWHSRSILVSAMSTHATQRDGSGTITISPRNEGEQSALMVICHGLGDSAEGFADVAEHLASQMPYVKFILPTAPTQRVTLNMGMPTNAWYDITGFSEESNRVCKGIVDSQKMIESILEKEHTETGLPYSRMVLAGFSQGGALSLFTGLQLDQAIAGVVVLSGYLASESEFKAKQLNVPVWHGHGALDPMVQFPMAQKSQEKALAAGIKEYTLESFPIQHTVSPAEIGKLMQFIKKVLPADDTCKIKLKDPKDMSVKELRAAIKKAGLGAKAVGLMEKSEFIKLVEDHRAGKA